MENLIKNLGEREFGFEKIAYLLLMGQLPDAKELIGADRIIRPAYMSVMEKKE